MIDYSLLFRLASGKRPFDAAQQQYDLLISAFNLTERVNALFATVNAQHKCWLIHNEYNFSASELPNSGTRLNSSQRNEGDFIIDVIGQLPLSLTPSIRLCIDVTGFMRAHIMFLMHFLKVKGIQAFDVVYSEPSHYSRRAETVFSQDVFEVRQVSGYEGVHSADMSNDLLVVGAGYDHELISNVLANKSNAKLMQLLSLPSLSADMYQESVVRLQKVADAPFRVPEELLAHSSANDPFVTYMILDEALKKFETRHGKPSNIYLSSLATKPQAVGFSLYFIDKLVNSAASLIMPFPKNYSKETSKGIGRAWAYSIVW
jgi:hypothetical protein